MTADRFRFRGPRPAATLKASKSTAQDVGGMHSLGSAPTCASHHEQKANYIGLHRLERGLRDMTGTFCDWIPPPWPVLSAGLSSLRLTTRRPQVSFHLDVLEWQLWNASGDAASSPASRQGPKGLAVRSQRVSESRECEAGRSRFGALAPASPRPSQSFVAGSRPTRISIRTER